MERMNPRLNTPPGKSDHVSLSRAARYRVLIRVAAEISSRDTPRISRSRFRCSPKAVEDIRRNSEPNKNIGAASRGVNPAKKYMAESTIRQPAAVEGRVCPLPIGVSAIGLPGFIADRESRSL